jgi:hypothetical protein
MKKKKLNLKRNTVAVLTAAHLDRIEGGCETSSFTTERNHPKLTESCPG